MQNVKENLYSDFDEKDILDIIGLYKSENKEFNEVLMRISQENIEFLKKINELKFQNKYQKETLMMHLAECCVDITKLLMQKDITENEIEDEIKNRANYEIEEFKKIFEKESKINESAEIYLKEIKELFDKEKNTNEQNNVLIEIIYDKFNSEIDGKTKLFLMCYLVAKNYDMQSKEFCDMKEKIIEFMNHNDIKIPINIYSYGIREFLMNEESNKLYNLFNLMNKKTSYNTSDERKKYYNLYMSHVGNKLLLGDQYKKYHFETKHEKISYANIFKPNSSGIPNNEIFLETAKVPQILFEINRLNEKLKCNIALCSLDKIDKQDIDFNNPVICFIGNYEHYFTLQYIQKDNEVIACVIDPSPSITPKQLPKMLKTEGGKADRVIYGYHENYKLQHSAYGCSIFALKNAVNFVKNKTVLHEFFLNNIDGNQDSKNPQAISWTKFPAEVLKTAQSMTLIDNSEKKEETLNKINKIRNSVKENHTEKNMVKGELRLQNVYINNHIKKSKERFAQHVLSSKSALSDMQVNAFLKSGKSAPFNSFAKKNEKSPAKYSDYILLKEWDEKISEWSQMISRNFSSDYELRLEFLDLLTKCKGSLDAINNTKNEEFYYKLLYFYTVDIEDNLGKMNPGSNVYKELQMAKSDISKKEKYIDKCDVICDFYRKHIYAIHNNIVEYSEKKNAQYIKSCDRLIELTNKLKETVVNSNNKNNSFGEKLETLTECLSSTYEKHEAKIGFFLDALCTEKMEINSNKEITLIQLLKIDYKIPVMKIFSDFYDYAKIQCPDILADQNVKHIIDLRKNTVFNKYIGNDSDQKKGRFHALKVTSTAYTELNRNSLFSNAHGDYLKSKILCQYKDRIENTFTIEDLNLLKKEIQNEEGYQCLQTAQGLFTKITKIKTPSINALEDMFRQQEECILKLKSEDLSDFLHKNTK